MLRRCVCEHGTHGDLPDVEWVKRGRVRLFPIVGTTQLPVLTPWKPARLSLPSMSKKSVTASSSSMGTWQEKIAATEQRVKERWEEEQRLRRRLRTRPPDDFKRRLDELLEDENGHEPMWVEIQAKQGQGVFKGAMQGVGWGGVGAGAGAGPSPRTNAGRCVNR